MRVEAILAVAVALVLLLPSVSAFANSYLPNDRLVLERGETGEYCIYLQNTKETEKVQIIQITDGAEYIQNIAEVTKEYTVPPNTISDDLPVCMKLKLPRDTIKGEEYLISYGVTTKSTSKNEGMVTFAPINLKETFYLTEIEQKEEHNFVLLFSLIGIFAAAIICVFKFKTKASDEPY